MKILLVDDETAFVTILTVALQLYRPGYSVVAAATGAEALAKIEEESPDIVLLDVVLPDRDGFQICREIRNRSDLPVILVTVKDREEDVIKGLEAGADDYISKPFSHKELIARIEAVLRRTKALVSGDRPGVFRNGELFVDFGQRQATIRGKGLLLTPKEYELLECLARNAGQIVSHDALLVKVWGGQYRGETQYLKTYIYRLRRKIEANPRQPRYLLSHYRAGYRLEPDRCQGPEETTGVRRATREGIPCL